MHRPWLSRSPSIYCAPQVAPRPGILLNLRLTTLRVVFSPVWLADHRLVAPRVVLSVKAGFTLSRRHSAQLSPDIILQIQYRAQAVDKIFFPAIFRQSYRCMT